MTRFINVLLLLVFALSWVPRGGTAVHYPALERILEQIDNKYPPEIAGEIRCHSIPSAMCGVKAVIAADKNCLSNITPSSSIHSDSLTTFEKFVLIPQSNFSYWNLRKQSALSQSISKLVLLPPPRLSV